MDPPVSTGETDAGGSSSAKEPPLNGSGDAGGHKETSAEEAHTSGKETHKRAEPAAVPVKKIKVYHSVSSPVNINYTPFL